MRSACWLALGLFAACGPGAEERRPNVVLLLADDLGWGDVGVHDGLTSTPNIDSIFREGIEIDAFLVTPVCTPSRAALLTGRHPVRVGLAPFAINPNTGAGLPADEVTLGEAFREAGYATACIGKWHLGNDPTPNEQGFDLFYGCLGASIDPFELRTPAGPVDWQENGETLSEKGYATDLIRDRAVRFIRDHAAEPFFLYVPFTAVHEPHGAPEAYLGRVDPDLKRDAGQAVYSAMILALDDAVGAIRRALESEGLSEDTIVVFASDNGAGPAGSNGPFQGGKRFLYEGGVRSPAAVLWEGSLSAGRLEGLFGAEDLFPTLLALSGVPASASRLDGLDASDALRANGVAPRETYTWVWQNCDAIRAGRWKLFRYRDRLRLYDVVGDPLEANDRAADATQIAAELARKLDAWETAVPCFPSHRPVPAELVPAPAPAGDVLAIPIGREGVPWTLLTGFREEHLRPGDRLEYDVYLAEGDETFTIDVSVRPDRERSFGVSGAVDQFGTPQERSARCEEARGRWVRRSIGLASHVPRRVGHARIASSGSPGGGVLYLDNLVVHRADGENIVLYRDGPPGADTPFEVVPASSVGER